VTVGGRRRRNLSTRKREIISILIKRLKEGKILLEIRQDFGNRILGECRKGRVESSKCGGVLKGGDRREKIQDRIVEWSSDNREKKGQVKKHGSEESKKLGTVSKKKTGGGNAGSFGLQ